MKTKRTQVLIAIVALLFAACKGGGSALDPSALVLRVKAARAPAPLAVCPEGGVTLSGGTDANGNGFLDSSEVVRTQRVCAGANGPRTLLRVGAEPAGVHCAAGGRKVSAGPDLNGNAVLDEAEVVASDFLCNGAAASRLARAGDSEYRSARGVH